MKSKKFLHKKFTLAGSILEEISKNKLCSEICSSLNISKQRLNSRLRIMEKEDLVERKARGIYRLSDSGKQILGIYMQQKRKKLIRLEQMKYRFPILQGVDNLINNHNWKQVQSIKHATIYHGSFQNHTARLFKGSKNPSLELYCGHYFGKDPYEIMFNARIEIEKIAYDIESKYQVKFGIPIPEMRPSFAIPTQLAQAVLTHTGASQWRTPRGTINRSKGRDADIEIESIHLAAKMIALPETVERVEERIIGIETSLGKVISELQLLSTKVSSLLPKS